jgi:hypothetical protein
MNRYMTLCLIATTLSCAGVRPDGGGGGYGGRSGRKVDGLPPPSFDARPERCDDGGDCRCMNIASLGKVAHYGGNNDSTDAFRQYLNTRSNARVSLLTNRTTITSALLSTYDVVILQALEDSEYVGFWSYSQAETDALAAWVEAGNGLIVLTGYGGVADEVNPSNRLLSFSGISYGKDDTLTSCPDNFCYCTESSIPFRNWSPGSFLAQNMIARDGQTAAAVGVFHGRPISCAATADPACEVVATDPQAGIVGVGRRIGKGRVFVWADEWVTYTSQWGAASTHGADCNGHTAAEIYNLPQFWYNVLRWVLPDASCFTIDDPLVIP